MTEFSLGQIVLFVQDVAKSTEFYASTLDLIPAFQSPLYAMFVLRGGIKLGLWARSDGQPKVMATPGATEVCFLVDDVDGAYNKLAKKSLTFLQEPTNVDFGRTFTFADPDGHRIRIYKLRM